MCKIQDWQPPLIRGKVGICFERFIHHHHFIVSLLFSFCCLVFWFWHSHKVKFDYFFKLWISCQLLFAWSRMNLWSLVQNESILGKQSLCKLVFCCPLWTQIKNKYWKLPAISNNITEPTFHLSCGSLYYNLTYCSPLILSARWKELMHAFTVLSTRNVSNKITQDMVWTSGLHLIGWNSNCIILTDYFCRGRFQCEKVNILPRLSRS